jgi:membrane protein
VLTELQTDLNLIWDVKPPVRKGWLGFVMGYLQPLVMVCVVGLVIIASLALSTVLGALSGALRQIAPWLGVLSALLDVAVTLASTMLAFAMAFKYLPGVRLAWRDVWVGALVTALLFGAGKYLITLYLTRTGAGSPYGAAGALVVLLMFVFYASQIFLLGAEFTQVWARTRGSRMREGDLLKDPVSWRGSVESDKAGVQDVMNATRAAAGRIKRP